MTRIVVPALVLLLGIFMAGHVAVAQDPAATPGQVEYAPVQREFSGTGQTFSPYRPDRLLIKIAAAAPALDPDALATPGGPTTGLGSLDALNQAVGVVQMVRKFPNPQRVSLARQIGLDRWYTIQVPAGDMEALAERYRQDPIIEAATPDYRAFPSTVPNDPTYPSQWGHNNTGQMLDYCWFCGGHPAGNPVGTPGFDSNAEQAWTNLGSFGSSGVVIAILDSGVDIDHPDLLANLVQGIDTGDNDNNPDDDSFSQGHGTATAGIAGAVANNNLGVAGIAGGCSIMPVKVADSNGTLFFSYIQDGLVWAADNGADVASMSFGASGINSDPATDNALQYAANAGVVLLAATGNSNASAIDYPASNVNVISVGAASPCGDRKRSSSNPGELNPGVNADPNGYTCDGERWWGSSYGSTLQTSRLSVSVIAPTIHPTTDIAGFGGFEPGDYDLWFNGTSCSTPYAAGVCGLIISANPTWTPTQVRDQLQNTAIDIQNVESGSGWDRYSGYGMVDAAAAVGGAPQPPTAEFSGSPTSGTEPLIVNFTDLSTGSITSWNWVFGDGNTSTLQNPSNTYNTAGTYTVALTVTGPGGSDVNTKVNYITVNPCNLPVADFSGTPTSGDHPLNVNFTDLSTNGPTSWAWDFGDGNTSILQNPSNTYTAAGTYTVTLTATNSCGSDQVVKVDYISVTEPPCNSPVADFTGSPTSGSASLNVNFTDLSTNGPTSWSWVFGDGNTSSLQNPSNTYTAAGTYTVTLTATNSCGSDQVVKVDYITVTAPPIGEGFILSRNPDFSTDDRVFDRSETLYMKVFSDQIDFNDLKKAAWELKSGGNRVKENLTNNFDNTYTAAYDLVNLPSPSTNWTWKADVQDNSGTRFRPSDNITVNDAPGGPPTAEFTGSPISGTAPLGVSFTDQSTGNPTSWSWDFGDGNNSPQQNPSNTYNNPGTYTVSLTATNAQGSDVNTKVDYITVNPCLPPVADFVGSPTTGNAPLAVSFTDQSTNSPSSWSWDFGDGNTSILQNPSNTYTAEGIYTVTLTATNSCGSDQVAKVDYITVNPCLPPVADFVGSPTTGNAPLAVSFTDQSTNSPSSWSWDFGDGNISTQQNPSNTYTADGTYTVTLSVTNPCGSDQVVKTDYITVSPGGPVTGEGYILSRNPDFSTDDRVFDRSETIYVKVWSDQVNFNDLATAVWQLKSGGNRVNRTLNNNFDNTYTDSYDLANLPSTSTSWGWKAELKDNSGTRFRPSDNITVNPAPASSELLSARGLTTVPFGISQNYPNPFRSATSITFAVPAETQVRVEVFDISGRLVAVLADEFYGVGTHQVSWNASRQPAGIYFYRIRTGEFTESRRMVRVN